jgi:hypothetical protein
MQFYPTFHHLIPPQYPVLKHPQSSRDQISHPYRTKGKTVVLYILFLCFSTTGEKTEGSGPNSSKHYQNSVSSQFPPESDFDLLLSLTNSWTVIHFQSICLLFLCLDFDLHSGDKTATCTFSFHYVYFRQTSLLASVKVSVFFFIVSMLSPSRFTSSV